MVSKTTAPLFAVICILSASVATSAGWEVDHVPVTPAEEQALDPVCRLIMIELPMGHTGNIAQHRNAHLFNRPEYHMAKNADHLHHRCISLIARVRYFSSIEPMQRRRWLRYFHDNMNYVLRNAKPDWQYYHQVCIEKAEIHYYEKEYTQALELIDRALKRNPDYEKAYSLRADVQEKLGKKPKAMESVVEGLKRNPNSKLLQRRYTKLGGKLPYPEPYPPPPIHAVEEQQQAVTDTSRTLEALPPELASKGKGEAAGMEAVGPATDPARDTTMATPSTTTPNTENPYCRFCP